MGKLTTEDWVTVSDHLGDYCWKVDEGDAEGWVALWTEDGIFTGVKPEPVVGREQLRAIPTDAYRDFGRGQMRHLVGNLTCRYGETRDVVKARAYNQVSVWGGIHTAVSFCMALCEMTLVRHGDGWLIKRNDAHLLTSGGGLPGA